MKHYRNRNIAELDEDGGHYSKHVAAMSEEGLHGKSEIAAELAWRDQAIERLRLVIEELRAKAERCDRYEKSFGLIPRQELSRFGLDRGLVIDSFENVAKEQHARSTAAELKRCSLLIERLRHNETAKARDKKYGRSPSEAEKAKIEGIHMAVLALNGLLPKEGE